MGSTRTAWHVLLAALLCGRAPRRFEVRSEVPLSTERLRADYLLLCTVAGADDDAGTLRELWKLLPKDTLLEFKSIGRPYRSRNLDRLLAYLHLHFTDEPERLLQRADLAGALLVPARTPALLADVDTLGFEWRDLGGGYWELTGGPFALYVVEIDVVAETEDDDLLRWFGHGEARTVETRRWLSEQVGAEEMAMGMHELEGYDEIIQKFVRTLPPEQRLAGLPPEQRLAGLPPEQRLAGLPPEQRLAGLPPEQVVLAMPDEVLRGLTDAYLATLPEPTRAAIRARIGR
jgi:hypothetical protein